MLDPQIIVNLFQQVRIGEEFVCHGHIDSVETSGVPWKGHAVTESSIGGDAMSAPH